MADDEVGHLMLEQLKLLRGDITQLREETKGEIKQLREETKEELTQLRQDTTRGFMETNTKLADLTGEVQELKDEVRELRGRFEHFIEFSGGEVRRLHERVDAHEQRLSRLEGGQDPSVLRERGPTYNADPDTE